MKNISAIIWSCIICFLWTEIDVGNPRDYTGSGITVDLSSASIDQRKEREYSSLNAVLTVGYKSKTRIYTIHCSTSALPKYLTLGVTRLITKYLPPFYGICVDCYTARLSMHTFKLIRDSAMI